LVVFLSTEVYILYVQEDVGLHGEEPWSVCHNKSRWASWRRTLKCLSQQITLV